MKANRRITLLPFRALIFAAAVSGIDHSSAQTAATWDAGGGSGDKQWSQPLNWSTDANPAGTAVVFGESNTTTATTPNNIVSQSITVESLTYQNVGTAAGTWHVTEIEEDVTLTLSGASTPLQVGIFGTTTRTTNVAIRGGGKLLIDQEGGVISLGNSSSGSVNNSATLDLANLAELDINLGSGSFGVGNATRNVATLSLARKNTLVASAIHVGGGSGNNSGGTISFDPLISGEKSIKIRGADDGAVASFTIAGYTGGATSGKQNGKVDFSGGDVDALVTNLLIASSQASNANGQSTGELTMDRGTFTAESVISGQSRANGNTAGLPNTGTINIHGGTFEAGSIVLAERLGSAQMATGILNVSGSGAVIVDGGITMGRRSGGTSTNALVATVNVDAGGSLSVGGDIARGAGLDAIDATLNLNGGSLDLKGHKIDVNTFAVKSGTLTSLGQFNDGANLVKTTVGTLLISGSNAYTGTTLVQEGALSLSGTLTQSSVTVSSGAEMGGKNGVVGGAITLESGASFSFTLDGSSDYGNLAAGSIVLGENANLNLALNFQPVANQSFTLLTGALDGAFATINGAAIFDNQFTLVFGSESYDFNLIYGSGNSVSITVVPEPGTFAMAGVASALLLAAFRRRQAGR